MKRADAFLLLGTFTLICALTAGPSFALRPPAGGSALDSRSVGPLGFVATVSPVELSKVADQVPQATLRAVDDFEADAGPGWRFYIDRRSGGMALAEGRGLPWTTAGSAASLTELENAARAFLKRYPALFQVPDSQLVLDHRGTVNLGERGQYWNVVFQQVVGGVPVDGARVIFRLSGGRLVQFGVDRTVPFGSSLKSAAGLISIEQARSAISQYIGGFTVSDRMVEDGTLLYVPRGVDETGEYTGPIGAGWKAELVYRFTFLRTGAPESWQALVDAKSGEVLRFVDTTKYGALLKASVYTLTNCADPLNCVPGTATETTVTVPNASVTFAGAICSGDGCYTNSAGAFDYPAGAVSATTALDGKYFRLNDACGALSASAVAPGNIDLGTSLSNPPLNTNTDCAPANRESAPNSGTIFGGAGDTHSARNTFYHLNLINQKARAYLPNNEWIKGVNGASGAALLNVNLPPACNAFWQGTTGTLNFMKQTPGLGCNNTGEVPDVFLHEWGHGLDDNDATGTAPESGTGEAMGDTFALLQGQHSCLGPGSLLDVSTPWGNQAGYGTGSALCTGFRDWDYTRFCYHSNNNVAACSASPDPGDAPNGSRSGFSPSLNVPDAGTPARWNTMITGASNSTNGQSNFYNCGGDETPSCPGALGHGCHCESQIGSQSNWDLVKKLIAFEFGGDIYRVPQGPLEVSGWQYMDRLWYLTRDIAASSYSATGPAPTGTTNGCGINNWYSTYRFIDDDDFDPTNGTPHAGIIFQALDLHAIACGNAVDPANQPTGCASPVAAPTLSACDNKAPVQLNWTASAGASQYRILRNTLGCGFGFTPIGTVGSARTYFEDAEVAPGIPYYYTVQPVGASESCYGFASNCIAVTPSACSASPLSAPTGLILTKPANNQVGLSWNPVAGAATYKISRKAGTCASTSPFSAIKVVTAPTVSYVDTDGLSGQQTYAYRIAASDGSCAACTSAPSVCQSVQVDGACATVPDFGGLTLISTPATGDCRIDLTWSAGTAHCAGSLTYNVYRATTAAFFPTPSKLIATGVTGTTYSDSAVTYGTRYYYIVRAVDSLGNSDANLIRLNEMPVGTLTPGTFSDNAGDTGTVKLGPGEFGPYTNTWTTRPNDSPDNSTKVYATTPSGNYGTNSCMGLETPTLFLGANPTLSFSTKYDMEQGWDGGYVDVATEAGAFKDWTKLATINYPGIMTGPAGDPACNTPGFADGQMVFTGTSTGYQTFSGSLSQYANQHVRVRFLFGSDPSTVQAGWFIDNVTITNTNVPGPCTTNLCANVVCDDANACTTDTCDSGNGQCSFTALPPPAEVSNSVSLAKNGVTTQIAWSDDGVPGSFDLYRGGRSTNAAWSYNQQCQGSPVAGTSTTDGIDPGADAMFFYFVTRKTACGESVSGRDSTGAPVPNTSPCP